MSNNLFDPNKSFIKLPIVYRTTCIFLIISATTAITITTNSNLTIDLTHAGFNFAATAFRFPLGILATLIPIIALMAANHRSEQTKEQMRLASENNNFTNYFKHLSEFESYIEKHKTKKDIKFKSVRNLHKLIFPHSKSGKYRTSTELSKDTNDTINQAIKQAESIKEIEAKIDRITTKHNEAKEPFNEKERVIAKKIKDLENSIAERKSKISISDITDSREITKALEEGNKKITAERERFEKIQFQIQVLSGKTNEEINPLTTEMWEINKQLQETSRKLIHKAKLIRLITINKTETDKEEKEIPLINEELKSEAETLGRLALAVHEINICLQFDEEYETPQNIELFINLFEGVEKKSKEKYKQSIEKYKEHMKTL